MIVTSGVYSTPCNELYSTFQSNVVIADSFLYGAILTIVMRKITNILVAIQRTYMTYVVIPNKTKNTSRIDIVSAENHQLSDTQNLDVR